MFNTRFSCFLIAIACFVSTTLAAQARQAEQTFEPKIAVVAGNNVYVRSGPGDSYYPFGRLQNGNLVEVIGETFNWSRIHVIGPSFKPGVEPGEFFGFVIHSKNDKGAMRVREDGKSGVTLGRVDVFAPNLAANFNSEHSWKPILRLDTNTTITILSTSEVGDDIVHRIVLPRGSEAWMSSAYLRDATRAEIDQWVSALASKPTARAKQPELSTPTPPPATRSEPPAEKPRETQPVAPPPPAPERAETPAVQQLPAEQPAPAPAPSPAPAPIIDDTPSPTLSEQIEKATLQDLETYFEKLRETPDEISEVIHLRHLYLGYADRHNDDEAIKRVANVRAEQLQLWREIREKQADIDRLRNRAQVAAERAESARLALYAHTNYDAIGRLTASTIYDGQRLPRMLRLQEPGTGRTLAYISPERDDEEYAVDLFELIGQWVGIVGEKEYDPALRLNILTPRRIDLLAPQ